MELRQYRWSYHPAGTPQRPALFRHERAPTVVGAAVARLLLLDVDDIQTGSRTGRSRAKGRNGLDGGLRQSVHQIGGRRERHRCGSGNPVPEGLFGVQHRADRWSARHLLCPAGQGARSCRAHRERRSLLQSDRRGHPPRRQSGLLFTRHGLHPDAAIRGVSRCGRIRGRPQP